MPVRIRDQQHFIVSSFDLATQCYNISFVDEPRLGQAKWDGSTRISPVWSLEWDRTTEPAGDYRPLTDQSQLCLVGPISPALLFTSLQSSVFSSLGGREAWLTLGFYNVLLVLNSADEAAAVRDFCVEHRCASEFWSLTDPPSDADFLADEIDYFEPEPLIAEVEKSQDSGVDTEDLFQHASLTSAIDASISQAFVELYSLIRMSKHRSRFLFGPLFEDIRKLQAHIPTMAEVFQGLTDLPAASGSGEPSNAEALKYRDQILNLNAGLSRHVSQALSGTSPVIQTECHFWPHSLLGAGVANLALRNLTAYIINSTNDVDYNRSFAAKQETRLEAIEAFRRVGGDVSGLRPKDYDAIEITVPSLEPAPEQAEVDPQEFDIPIPVTYFSGRDGFRYGTFTASAPLLSVSGCNSKQWNLGTISHELSHRIVSPKIQLLVAKSLDAAASAPSIKDLCKRRNDTVEEASIALIVHSLNIAEGLRIGEGRYKEAVIDPAAFLRAAVRHGEHEIEERIVHIFDYYHFYNQDPASYVSNIWQSWAVQPSIATKFERYVERTAVALAVKHVGAANWYQLAYDDFREAAADKHFWHESYYRGRLAEYLDQNRQTIEKSLDRNWAALSLFLLTFKSTSLATATQVERRDTAQAKQLQLYDDSGLAFPKFTNPLRFVRQMASDKVPNGARSAWLLSALAFGTTQARSKAYPTDE